MKHRILKRTLAGVLAILCVGNGFLINSGERIASNAVIVANAEEHTQPYIDEDKTTLHLAGSSWTRDSLYSDVLKLPKTISNGAYTKADSTIKKVVADPGTVLPSDCSSLFALIQKAEEIDLSNANASNVTNMQYMFINGTSSSAGFFSLEQSNSNSTLKKITFGDSFDTSNVTNMQHMFSNCKGLTELDLSSFDTSNVTNMQYMFYYCSSLTKLDLSSIDTSNVTNMQRMFYYCSSLTKLDLSSFNTSNVTDMQYMFGNCRGLTELDLSSFDTGNVTNMQYMFSNCVQLTKIYASKKWNTDKVNSSSNMFNKCSNLVGGNGTAFGTIVDKTYARIDKEGEPGYFTEAVTYTKHEPTAPTCTTTGNSEYYEGTDGKYYTYADGVYTETTLEAVTIPATGHSYEFTSKTNNADGSLTAVFTCKNNTSHTKTVTLTAVQMAQIVEALNSNPAIIKKWEWAADYSSATYSLSGVTNATAAEGYIAILVSEGIDADLAGFVVTNGMTVPATITTESTPATYEAAGSIKYTAHVNTMTDDKEVSIPQLTMAPSWYINAEGSRLNMNILVPIADNYTMSDYTATLDGEKQTLSAFTDKSGKKYGMFTVICAAKEMADVKSLQISAKDEGVLFTKDISARKYLTDIIANNSLSDYHEIAKSMLRYGAAAQNYFSYKTETPANDGIDGYELDSLNSVNVPETAFDGTALNSFLTCCEYAGINMTFTADTSLMLAYRVNADSTANQAKADVEGLLNKEGVTVNTDIIKEGSYSISPDNSGSFIILKIDNIPIKKLDTPVLTTNDMTLRATDYLAKAQLDSDNNLKNLCKALYAFYAAIPSSNN